MFDVVIVGAGASGLVCAIQAARRGLSVCLLERNSDPGKKIRQTGNGRCNLSNLDMHAGHFHGASPDFVEPALSGWSIADLTDFSESIGMPLTALPDGRIFPHSLQAKTVVRALLREAESLGVVLVTGCYCKHVQREIHGWKAIAFDNRPFMGRKLVLAAGGSAMKKSGSDGNGFELAKRLGHTVTDVFPGIVALTLKGRAYRAMNGVKFPSKVTLYIDNQPHRTEYGDILFTDYGISGPPVLQLSRHANEALLQDRCADIGVSLVLEDWADERRIRSFLGNQEESLREALSKFLNDKIIDPLLKQTGITENTPFYMLRDLQKDRLIAALLDWRFSVSGSKTMDLAQVTCGGVDTDEIDRTTMGSKMASDLYLIGEIADIDGDCGGYNLHWAFASATLCAKAL